MRKVDFVSDHDQSSPNRAGCLITDLGVEQNKKKTLNTGLEQDLMAVVGINEADMKFNMIKGTNKTSMNINVHTSTIFPILLS